MSRSTNWTGARSLPSQTTNPDPQLAAFLRRRRRAAARLREVNRQLSAWDEYECCQAMPADIRPVAVAPRTGQRELKARRALLLGVIDELEAGWERRN